MALKGDAHQQGIFSRRSVASAIYVHGLDVSEFGDAERPNHLDDLREGRSVGQEQREIALDRREARQRRIPQSCSHLSISRIKVVELQLGDEDILSQL